MEWLLVVGRELVSLAVLAERTYTIDETGVLLSVLNSLKVLGPKSELKWYRRAGVKRTLITVVKCVSADGQYLHYLDFSTYSYLSEHLYNPTQNGRLAISSGYS